ncbi:MAG TPA: SPASM domain-containing protein [Anaerolineales bacterium]|nr:SPASM domain-containing protein [Anaerolineales bacterium]
MGIDGSAPTSLARRTSRAGSGDPAGSASESSSATATWLAKARERAAELGLDLIWDLPAPYSRENPMALEVAEEATPGAGRAWLYVEPDGDVLPTQGVETVLGNLQRDAWETIWGRAKDWASERS